MSGWMDWWADGKTGGWMDGRVGGQVDGFEHTLRGVSSAGEKTRPQASHQQNIPSPLVQPAGWLQVAEGTRREGATSRGPLDPQLWLLQEVDVIHPSISYQLGICCVPGSVSWEVRRAWRA